MVYIPEPTRQQIFERAHGLCEYCQTAQIIVVTIEIDHIIPQVAGGKTQLENLCLVCRGCNGFKQHFQTGVDPTTGIETALFDPRNQVWKEHFQWNKDGSVLIGLTAIGSATIERLRINREGIVASRRLWVEAGWHPPKLDD